MDALNKNENSQNSTANELAQLNDSEDEGGSVQVPDAYGLKKSRFNEDRNSFNSYHESHESSEGTGLLTSSNNSEGGANQ